MLAALRLSEEQLDATVAQVASLRVELLERNTIMLARMLGKPLLHRKFNPHDLKWGVAETKIFAKKVRAEAAQNAA
ncbi:hypothetical protein H632_c2416p1 [Helicosporidium sp. ATCC 50920]|nr:hypothetical protein H632_c2416p1 [Helicosporidium sp. ATCC 50920]|eukprot:KDD73217.1 hypothetical protein H632_c2416p1 [Helicosporidium sp. ATCC 50920]